MISQTQRLSNKEKKTSNTWRVLTLGEVGDIVSGGTPSTAMPEYWGGEINWISPSDLTGYKKKNIKKGAKSITKLGLKNSSARMIPKGSVLFSSRAPIGYVVIAAEDLSTNQGFKSIVPHDFVSSEYLYYYLKASKHLAENAASGTTFKEISKSKFSELQIPIPSLDIQHAIVSKIEELFSELEKGIESLKLAQQKLKVYRQSVLKWAFEGKLTNEDVKVGELPEWWKMDVLGAFISEISAGKSITCDERPPKANEFGIVKVSAVSWGFFDESESKTCLSANNYNKEYIIKPGDFLFSRANTIDLVGACVIVRQTKGNLMLSDKILRFKFTEHVVKEYVLYFLRSKIGRRQIEGLSTGNQDSMRNIGQAKIKMIQMPYCNLEEQKQIVNEINDRFSITEKMEESINQSLQQAEVMRQSILKRAFEGELVTSIENKKAKAF